MIMRRLTSGDWPDIEQVLDTRKNFQSQPVADDWHQKLKDIYVRSRLDRPAVYFWGYFNEDGELIGLREAHRTTLLHNFAMGISYTKAGKASERWPNSNWPKVVIELNQFALDSLIADGMTTLWLLGPATIPAGGRLVDDPGSPLSDRAIWNRTDVMMIPAGTFSGDAFIDSMVLVSSKPLQDQIVMKFDLINPVVFTGKSPGPDAPPRGKKPTPHPHPPRGDKPTPHDPPIIK